jgi:uncharacterized membrane protein
VAVTARRAVLAGAVVTVVGVAIAATAPIVGTQSVDRTQGQQTAGGIVVLGGWALLAWAVHRLGRESSR